MFTLPLPASARRADARRDDAPANGGGGDDQVAVEDAIALLEAHLGDLWHEAYAADIGKYYEAGMTADDLAAAFLLVLADEGDISADLAVMS